MTLVIPAYDPNGRLESLVRTLRPHFTRLVVVDDGSKRGRECLAAAAPFADAILTHPVNRGKGAALKTAFAFIGEDDVVTADADGQHLPEDILKIAEALKTHRDGLVLGVRTFAFGTTPFRSLWGGWWTRLAFRLLTGLRFADTQTGLRGIPSGLLRRVAALPGDRYDYEMAMLADARHHASRPYEIAIATVYHDNNAGSHFRPLADTLRNYATLLRVLVRRFGSRTCG